MTIFLFPVPKTEPTHKGFEKLYKYVSAEDLDKLKRCVKHRDELVKALKSNTTPESRMAAIENYFPFSASLTTAIVDESSLMKNNKALRFKWTSVLTQDNPGMHGAESFLLDHIMCLLTFGMLLNNSAYSTLADAGDDMETSGKKAAQLLAVAAGVFEHVYALVVQAGAPENWAERRPIEVNTEIISALVNLCLADGQHVALYRAHKRASNGLIAKIAIDTANKFIAAEEALAKVDASTLKRLDRRFKAYVSVKAEMWQAVSHKYLAREAYEAEKFGVAVGHTNVALDRLRRAKAAQCKDPDKALVDEVNFEVTSVTDDADKYKKDNDNIYYEKVPAIDELPSPPPKELLAAVPYNTPPKAFESVTLTKPDLCCIQ